MVDYRVYVLDEDGKVKDVTFRGDLPLELIKGMNIGKSICLYLAKALEKDWVWNENYPETIATKTAELVVEAMGTS